jgi:rubrerythrin
MATPGSRPTLEDLFERAIEIEKTAAEVYATFSRWFSHVPRVSAFWRELNQDEIEHAETLGAIRDRLTPQQLSSAAEEGIWKAVHDIRNRLRKDWKGHVDTLDDAYDLAHELEFSEVNAVFRFLAVDVVPSEEREKFVVSQITQHQQKLLDFGQEFADRAWRRQIHSRRT